MPREFDADEPEMMDRPQPVSEELERDLGNLISLNRWFGSRRQLLHFLRRWWRAGESCRVLDLCTGAGDLPRAMVDFARSRGVTISVVAVDANPATMAIARQLSAGYPEISFIEGNALTFGAPGEYDLVHCSLALHHFSDDDATRILTRCRVLCKRWALVSDLERSLFTTLGVWLLTALIYRDPMTRHDGRVSAKRAFSFGELHGMAEASGWTAFGHARFLGCRQALWTEDAAETEDVGLPAEPCMG